MKYFVSLCFFILFAKTIQGIELPLAAQAKITQVLLSKVQPKLNTKQIYFLNSDIEVSQAKQLNVFKAQLKEFSLISISVEEFEKLSQSETDLIYILPENILLENYPGFCVSNSFDQVKRGCLVGFELIGTNPKIQMNLRSLKREKFIFPSSLLKLVELIDS